MGKIIAVSIVNAEDPWRNRHSIGFIVDPDDVRKRGGGDLLARWTKEARELKKYETKRIIALIPTKAVPLPRRAQAQRREIMLGWLKDYPIETQGCPVCGHSLNVRDPKGIEHALSNFAQHLANVHQSRDRAYDSRGHKIKGIVRRINGIRYQDSRDMMLDCASEVLRMGFTK